MSPLHQVSAAAWVAALPAAAAIIDRHLRFVAVNSRLAAINGRPVQEHVGRPIGEIVPDLEGTWRTTFESVLTSGVGLHDLELRGRTPAEPGAERVWREAVEPLRHETTGEILGLVVLVEEVTEQHRTSAALAAGDQRGAALAALARQLLVTPGLDELVPVLSEGARAVSGSDRVGIFAVTPSGLELLNADDYPEHVLAAIADGIPEDSPVGFVARTRESLWLSSLEPALERFHRVAPVAVASGDQAIAVLPLLADGELVGVLHLGYDHERELGLAERDDLRTLAGLTAAALLRARMSAAHEESRRLLEGVLQHIPVGVSITDASGGAIVSNPAVAAIWAGDRISASIEEYAIWPGFHPDGRRYDNHEWPLARSIEHGEIVVDERIEIERFDGTRGAISISSAPVRDGQGGIIAGVAVVLDVTGERRAQEARDAFIGVLSHELRTPLTAVVAGASLLARREGLEPSIAQSVASDVAMEASRLQQLVEDVLVLSRVDRGVDLRRVEPVLVHHVVRRVISQEQQQWPGVVIDLEEAPNPVMATGDETYLAQVLRNLLSNGAKYGHGRVKVRVGPVDGGMEVEVRDDGPGPDPEERHRLFELFFRSRSSRKRAPGAGIGLFVSRQLVRAMGGSIEYREDATADGGYFRVWLPAYEEEAGGVA